ncbi:MAG: MFS transporter [Candidatus Brocadiia bacterium]
MDTENENKEDGPLKGISRNTLLLGIVSFFNDLSSDMIYPHVVAVFLSSVLGVPAIGIGLIGGVAQATASILKPVSGWFSDVFRKRKPAIFAGYWLAACTRPLLSAAGSLWHVLGLRFLDRLGKGVRTAPRDALIADSTPSANRGKAFGLHRTLDTAGAAVGMFVAFLILKSLGSELETSLRTLIWIAALPGVVAVSIVMWGIRERVPETPEDGKLKFGDLREILTPDLIKWYVIVFVFWLGNSSNMFLILRASDLDLAIWHMPLLVFAMSVVHALFSTPAGIVSDKIGRKSVIVTAWVYYSAVYFGFAFAASTVAVYVLFAAYGLFYALSEGVERAFAADLAPKRGRATGIGFYHFVVGAAALPASLICGLLWEWDRLGEYGPHVALGFGASCALLAALLFLILNPRAKTDPTAGSRE